MKQDGHTVLLTTHYLDEAEALCDRIAIIDRGRVIAAGSPRELMAALDRAAVRVPGDHGAARARLARRRCRRSRPSMGGGASWRFETHRPQPHARRPR